MPPLPYRNLFVLGLLSLLVSGRDAGRAGETTVEQSTAAVSDSSSLAVDAAADEFFELQVRPLFIARCHACHSEDKASGSLQVISRETLLQGGESGPAIVPGDPDASLLIAAIEQSGDLSMPPNGKLTDSEIVAVRRWVQQGAPWPQGTRLRDTASNAEVANKHWSFRPLQAVAIPNVVDIAHRMRTPVDAFVLAKLEGHGILLAPDADRITLIRRVTFDLTGLPPSPEEVDEFVRDPRPDAYERLVDRLLNVPTFGERWGRHWLDVSGYVDTLGYDVNIAQFIRTDNKWHYRDYVVRSMNADRAFNEFIAEQLAGDELSDWRVADQFTQRTIDPLIATGYLRNAEDRTDESIAPVLKRYEVLYDTLQIFGSNFLGLSLQCARCHDHKYEPVSQEDYYRLMAIFTPAFNPNEWKNPQTRPVADVPQREKEAIDEHNRCLDASVAKLNERAESLKQPYVKQVLESRIASLPVAIRSDTQKALDTLPADRDEIQKYLAKQFAPLSKVTLEDTGPFLSASDQIVRDEIQGGLAATQRDRRSYGILQAVYDVGAPPPTYILHRGDHESPAGQVEPGFLAALSNAEVDTWMPVEPISATSSGRRTAVAQWITNPQSPASALTVRILVNRLWYQLTGRGIVASRDNFGVTGTPPTHPELLDWLSREFVQGGWRVKPILRTILLSSTYRQATYRDSNEELRVGTSVAVSAELVDPGNELLWKMRLRRLESECIRDAMLSASGSLNPEIGGAPVLTVVQPDGMTVISDKQPNSPAARWRRSLYLLNRRQCNLSFLSVFDQPSMNVNCVARQASAVPLQSLTMMNGDLVWEQAEQLARRVLREAGGNTDDQIVLAFRLTLARKPDADEVSRFQAYLTGQAALMESPNAGAEQGSFRALVSFCQTLLNTNEFIYVE
ncbi:MAG: PSD1 and planctomycete cytochrome C domain-containing protein [Planctomycetota bacterium]|nr:PSD1 and planctomycete cytochrome C domain-containing protein [Planctomycetota bacterium]